MCFNTCNELLINYDVMGRTWLYMYLIGEIVHDDGDVDTHPASTLSPFPIIIRTYSLVPSLITNSL